MTEFLAIKFLQRNRNEVLRFDKFIEHNFFTDIFIQIIDHFQITSLQYKYTH